MRGSRYPSLAGPASGPSERERPTSTRGVGGARESPAPRPQS